MPKERRSAGDRINLPKTKADEYFDSVEVKSVGQSTSQEVNKQFNKSGSQDADNPTSQQANKLRKATFKLSQSVLEQLDTFHLQLQLELGKANAPYKEAIVEEAISQLLEQMLQNRDLLVARLQERQRRSRG
ncbi:hypothetical protein C7Y66_02380 [Chroococcidiopsis sp. CCALA 051]|uniref:hypothetical protein n=1 Tax=Chroococcidiopsis sp. CCALA 051 TaxID=869949 RepID=UPI000D07FD72|nr:hypothetical protein [Chroococcidiopsis sp. CCALA 051]PSB43735.1 hypothetical protein C7B80_23050 [Cyanosarcina cf. burmensis CCALA 770]PSM50727.1 hypothetical protein C7Y66_02380 [Chroococcidiopsis sp. CCALA 051]